MRAEEFRWKCRRAALVAAMAAGALLVPAAKMLAQASTIPSAQGNPGDAPDRGRKLLDQMVAALGGDAWLNRVDWKFEGKAATFYKSAPNPYVAQFEEYYRGQPFGERVVIVSKLGVFIPTAHRDVAEVWNNEGGWEVTFRGKKPLPKEDVADFERRRAHALDVVVKDWLHQPGVLVTYEGTDMVGRKLVDKVSVLTTNNDAVELDLDETTHLPLSRTFKWRDAIYKDLDTDEEQYDDYHTVAGVMTPLTITRVKNGDMVSQHFLDKATYNLQLAPDLFNPDRPLERKPGK